MRAARYTDFGGDITIVDVRDPEPPSGGVVVRVEATGVCRSDWHGWQGHDADISLPHVPGHEFAGTVTAVGRDVTTVAVGQRIAVPFILGCGACAECRMGDTQLCRDQVQPGFHLDGSFAELVAVPRADVNVAVIPDGVSVAAAASLGCRYATAWRAVVERAGVGAGDRIVVFGCGGVGLAAVQIAVAHGAEVAAVDPAPIARDRALAGGAGHAAADAAELPWSSIDVTVDAIGHASIAGAALPLLRPGGTHVQVGILGEAAAPVPLSLLMRRELNLVGSHGMAAGILPHLLGLVASGHLAPEKLITRRVGLTEGIEYLRVMPERPGDVVLIDRMTP